MRPEQFVNNTPKVQTRLSLFGKKISFRTANPCLIVSLINKYKNQRNDRQRVNTNGGNQSVAKIVKQVLDSKLERKFALTSFSSGVSTTLAIQDLTSIPQGNTAQSRIGATIQVRKLSLKWVAAIGDATNLIRFAIIKWHPSDTVDLPQQSEVWMNTSTLSPFLKMNPSRYTRVHDSLIYFDAYHPVRTGNIEIDLNHLVQYDIGVDTGCNHLYLLVYSDSGAVPNPTFEFVCKATYTD